jgi:hypothetical protein
MTVFPFVIWDDQIALTVIGIVDVFTIRQLSNLGKFGGENSAFEGCRVEIVLKCSIIQVKIRKYSEKFQN